MLIYENCAFSIAFMLAIVDILVILFLGSLLTFVSFQKFEVEQTTGCNSSRNWWAEKFNSSVSNFYPAVNFQIVSFCFPLFYLIYYWNIITLCRYLSFNNFKGEIPKELANLPDLRYLYLHENRLTGRIPPELGTLQNLRHL